MLLLPVPLSMLLLQQGQKRWAHGTTRQEDEEEVGPARSEGPPKAPDAGTLQRSSSEERKSQGRQRHTRNVTHLLLQGRPDGYHEWQISSRRKKQRP